MKSDRRLLEYLLAQSNRRLTPVEASRFFEINRQYVTLHPIDANAIKLYQEAYPIPDYPVPEEISEALERIMVNLVSPSSFEKGAHPTHF